MKNRVAGVLVSTACAVGLMGTTAFAAPSAHHHSQWGGNIGNINILSGNSIFMPIASPINVCGNAIAIYGFAQASCQGGAVTWMYSG